jgi:hypothetical protein
MRHVRSYRPRAPHSAPIGGRPRNSFSVADWQGRIGWRISEIFWLLPPAGSQRRTSDFRPGSTMLITGYGTAPGRQEPHPPGVGGGCVPARAVRSIEHPRRGAMGMLDALRSALRDQG